MSDSHALCGVILPGGYGIPDFDLTRRLFDDLHEIGLDGRGMTRSSYGEGENRAHRLLADVARAHGLEIRTDWAANLFITLPGRNRSLPVVMTGSHVDTVRCGGNYDGAAGVLAGLGILCGWKQEGFVPERDTVLIVTRAEESVWFPISYIGSRTAFGLLEPGALGTCRSDGKGTLAELMLAAGGAPAKVGVAATLDPAAIDCFVELHIEQGPVLPEAGAPVGIVTGICGSLRYRNAVVSGRYTHSGATPRRFRADAVVATAAFVTALQKHWQDIEEEGGEMTLTFGVCRTDPVQANFSAVSGKVELAIDIRSRDVTLLNRMDALVQETRAEVETRYGVTVDLGERTGSSPAVMDAVLQAEAQEVAGQLGIATVSLPSGAGHDAATFASQGVPTEMIFVRNANGSHNPDESMEHDDFVAATRILNGVLRRRAERR